MMRYSNLSLAFVCRLYIQKATLCLSAAAFRESGDCRILIYTIEVFMVGLSKDMKDLNVLCYYHRHILDFDEDQSTLLKINA